MRHRIVETQCSNCGACIRGENILMDNESYDGDPYCYDCYRFLQETRTLAEAIDKAGSETVAKWLMDEEPEIVEGLLEELERITR
jgi:hypothetical protein